MGRKMKPFFILLNLQSSSPPLQDSIIFQLFVFFFKLQPKLHSVTDACVRSKLLSASAEKSAHFELVLSLIDFQYSHKEDASCSFL